MTWHLKGIQYKDLDHHLLTWQQQGGFGAPVMAKRVYSKGRDWGRSVELWKRVREGRGTEEESERGGRGEESDGRV